MLVGRCVSEPIGNRRRGAIVGIACPRRVRRNENAPTQGPRARGPVKRLVHRARASTHNTIAILSRFTIERYVIHTVCNRRRVLAVICLGERGRERTRLIRFPSRTPRPDCYSTSCMHRRILQGVFHSMVQPLF